MSHFFLANVTNKKNYLIAYLHCKIKHTMLPFSLHTILIQVELKNLIQIKNMYVQQMQSKEILTLPGMAVVELANKTIVELYTEISEVPTYLFKKNKIVLGFRTQQIEETFKQFTQNEYKILSPIQQAGNCYKYFHYESNEQVYMICELVHY